jgi:pimeloyl-ACP methyl ester carboxylesterase
MLEQAISAERLPIAVEHFEWTHGYLRVLADHLDTSHSREQGRRLAERVCALRQECPGRAVYIISHSAGSAVALAAASYLPPDGVTRIVLLAPSVSATYDLRPALVAAAKGVDVFYSRRDWVALGIGTGVFGTTDRTWCPAAGRVGFWPDPGDLAQSRLLPKLRQHPWDPCLTWAGNSGGHYGTYQPAFLRAYVLPLLNEGSP